MTTKASREGNGLTDPVMSMSLSSQEHNIDYLLSACDKTEEPKPFLKQCLFIVQDGCTAV